MSTERRPNASIALRIRELLEADREEGLGPEAEAELFDLARGAAEALESPPSGPLAFEARFNGGQGGASIYLGGVSAFVQGRAARDLAEALDPGRSSRPFAAELGRRIERAEARLARMAAQIRADGDPSHLAEQAEGIAAELRGKAAGSSRPASSRRTTPATAPGARAPRPRRRGRPGCSGRSRAGAGRARRASGQRARACSRSANFGGRGCGSRCSLPNSARALKAAASRSSANSAARSGSSSSEEVRPPAGA